MCSVVGDVYMRHDQLWHRWNVQLWQRWNVQLWEGYDAQLWQRYDDVQLWQRCDAYLWQRCDAHLVQEPIFKSRHQHRKKSQSEVSGAIRKIHYINGVRIYKIDSENLS